MSENKHTPEPWAVSVEIFDNDGVPETAIQALNRSATVAVALDFGLNNPSMREANARRIVACVNACAGISQQYLEELNGETLADKQMVLITQRDEYSLLAYRRQNILDEVIKQRDELLAEFAAYKEGSEEAFGAVVAQKQAAEARLQTMQSTIASQQGVICDFREQRDELLAALEGLTGDIQALIGESCGVSGLHMNGDIAPWDELESGGRFERLTHLPCAHAAIARVKGEQ